LARSGLPRQQATESLHSLVGEGQILVLDDRFPPGEEIRSVPASSLLITRSGWGALRERIEALLKEYHRQFPLRAGMPREETKSRLAQQLPKLRALPTRLFNEIINRAISEGWLADAGTGADRVRLASHQPRFSRQQQQDVDFLLFTFHQQPYTTPSVAQCEEQVGSEVLNALIEQGQMVRLNEDVILLTETYTEMQDRIVSYLQEHDSITVAQVRDMFDTSRKYALALVGYLDERRITRRVGDERVLR
jgi:selenocysteine-specific elongation factor